MSFNNQEYDQVTSLMSPEAVAFFSGIDRRISQSMLPIVEVMLDRSDLQVVVKGYNGSQSEVLLKAQDIKWSSTNPDQNAADLYEEVRRIIQQLDPLIFVADSAAGALSFDAPSEPFEVVALGSYDPVNDNLVTTPVRAKLPKSGDTREKRSYPCDDCKAESKDHVCDGISDLYAHLFHDHGKAYARKKLAALGHVDYMDGRRAAPPSIVIPDRIQDVPVSTTPMFEPKYRLDLSEMADGRYAAEMPDGSFVYVRKTTLKRAYTRNGRFKWGQTTRSWERIPAGTVEVRKQAGDTKQLFGEVREGIYYGEQEEAMKIIVANPPKAAVLYGEKMKCCGYCGKSLTDPESQARHIGPDCWEDKHLPAMARQLDAIMRDAS